MDTQSSITHDIEGKLYDANQFILNINQITSPLNATQLAALFKKSIALEIRIFQEMQQTIQTIEVNNSNQTGAVLNLSESLEVIERCKNTLSALDKFQQEVTKSYQNFNNNNDKKIFMSSVLNCDLSDPSINLYDNLLQKIEYNESARVKGNLTFVPIDNPTDPAKISFDTDLLKLMATKTGLVQLKDIHQKLDKLKDHQSGKIKVSFRDEKDSMSYSQNSTDVIYNKQEVASFNNKYEGDTPGYISKVTTGMPPNFIVKSSTLPNGRIQTLLYPKPGAREKVAVKIGEKDGLACICISPRIASFSHELGHMQRAMQGQFEKDIPVPKMFGQIYDNLEEFYTVLLENQLLAELGLPPRITHAGTVIDPNKLMDSSYLKSLDNTMLLFLSKGNIVLGNLNDIFQNAKEDVLVRAQQLTSHMENLSHTTCKTIQGELIKVVNPKNILGSSSVIANNLNEEAVTDIHNIIMQNINFSPNVCQAVLSVIKDCESTKLGYLPTDRIDSKLKQIMIDSIPKDLIKNYVEKAINPNTPNKEQVVNDICYNIKSEYEKFLGHKIVTELLSKELEGHNIEKVMDTLKQEFYSNLQSLYVFKLDKPMLSEPTFSTQQLEGWQSSNSNNKFTQIAEEHKAPEEIKKTEPQTVITSPPVATETETKEPENSQQRRTFS